MTINIYVLYIAVECRELEVTEALPPKLQRGFCFFLFFYTFLFIKNKIGEKRGAKGDFA